MNSTARKGLEGIRLLQRGFRPQPGNRASGGGGEATHVYELDLCQIATKTQVRKDFQRIEQLAASIRELGIINPPTVRWFRDDQAYLVVAGERRVRAARLAGLTRIRCIVEDIDDLRALEVQLIENVQREDLNPIEEAQGYRELMNLASCTARDVAKRLGKHETTITRSLRLLSFSNDVQDAIATGQITKSVARELARIDNTEKRQHYLERATSGNLTAAEAADVVQRDASREESTSRRRIKRQLVFDVGDGFEVTIRYSKRVQEEDISYHHIARAVENAQSEVAHRIRNRCDLNWDATKPMHETEPGLSANSVREKVW